MGKARWVWECDGICAKTHVTYMSIFSEIDVNASTAPYHQIVNSGHLWGRCGTGEKRNRDLLDTAFMHIGTWDMDLLSLFQT